MAESYQEDLAYIHDIGFGDYAVGAAPGIIEILTQYQIEKGLIVELGCGSGLLARSLTEKGYDVLGIDTSATFIKMAQARVPKAKFQLGSLWEVEIPPCDGVIAIGECLNYQPGSDRLSLRQLYQRIKQALNPGGVLIFDIAEPGQVPLGKPVQSFREGKDWIVLVEKEESATGFLTRRIISFRQIGDSYRRAEELHIQRLYQGTDLAKDLESLGFQVTISDRYGSFPMLPDRCALIAVR